MPIGIRNISVVLNINSILDCDLEFRIFHLSYPMFKHILIKVQSLQWFYAVVHNFGSQFDTIWLGRISTYSCAMCLMQKLLK